MTYIFNSSFLRGLGIGLIISGLVLSISKTAFFDQQGTTFAPPNTNPASTTNVENTATNTAANTKPAETSTKTDTGANPGVTNQTAGPAKTGAAANPANSPAAAKPETNYVTFVVPRGSNSGKIAGLLLNAGLITDKAKFESVVLKMRAARRFKAGTFTIPKGASEVDIVLALTN